MYIVKYIIKSLTKAQRKRKNQIFLEFKVTNEFSHDSKSLFIILLKICFNQVLLI